MFHISINAIKEFIRTMLMIVGALLYHNKQSKVLYYHDVHDEVRYTSMSTPKRLFIKHYKQIKKSGYQVVKHIFRDERQVQIAFDDGFRGIWENKDFFIQNYLDATIFITTSLIGNDGYLTEEEIIALHHLGFNIQSHTVTHCNLTTLNAEELSRELINSKLYLERLLDKQIEEICVPIGYISDIVYRNCLRSGYSKIYSSIPGNYFDKQGDYDFLIFRNLVQHQTPFQLRLTLLGGNEIFQLKSKKLHFKN